MTTRPNLSRKGPSGNDVCGASSAEDRKTCRNYVERVDDGKITCKHLFLKRACCADPEMAAKRAEVNKYMDFERLWSEKKKNERAGGKI